MVKHGGFADAEAVATRCLAILNQIGLQKYSHSLGEGEARC